MKMDIECVRNETRDNLSHKNIDLKSFLIGFFFATTILLAIGASKGTQDVRIVGIDEKFGDWDSISVKTE
jgi:hypothetical protein